MKTTAGGGGESGGQEGFKVAVLTPGTSNDGSWGEAVSEGAEETAEKYGADVQIAANLEEPAQYQQQGLALAQAGYNVVINANAAMGSVTEELAKKFPDTKFGQVAVGIDPLPENVATNTPLLPDATFQAGVLAGLTSKSGTVGTIGGFEFPALTSEMEGFALGARYANPKIKVLRTYINTWTDAGKAKAAAQAQASQGADVIFSATDQATQGIYQLAESGGTLKYVIPQYLDKSSQAPNVVLTSAVYNLQGSVGSFIEMYANEDWRLRKRRIRRRRRRRPRAQPGNGNPGKRLQTGRRSRTEDRLRRTQDPLDRRTRHQRIRRRHRSEDARRLGRLGAGR